MFPLLLLCAICSLTSPSVPDQEFDNPRLLKVTISKSPPVSAILGSSLTLTCLVSLAETPTAFGRHAVLTTPLVKWSVLSSGLEMEILVARGGRVKVSDIYKGRASLPNYTSSSTSLTLRLEGLRYNDSGVYRCAAQQGLEDSNDQVPIMVKGVVFHYRHASSHYAFSFREAQTACEDIGAQMATPAQFLAGSHNSPEACSAGWLSDQTVRYPIQSPKEGCLGDKEKERGMWNYTVRDPLELWDVYCYVEDIAGKVLFSCTPQHLTLKEAKEYCQAGGAELANLAQVYAAWNNGLYHCSPGWLADGSVRYPVGNSRGSCRGSTPGVKTIYRFSNQTSFPEPHTLHGVYCFQDLRSSPIDDSRECLETKPETRNQGIMTTKDPLQELISGQETLEVKNELDGVIRNGGQIEDPGTTKSLRIVPSLPDTSSPTDSQNLATPTLESKVANVLMKGAINSKNYEPLTETNLKSEVLTPVSEMLIGNSKHYQKMKLESSDPIPVSEMSANSKHNQRIHQTNLECGDIKPSNQMTGDRSKHYQDMPETNLESGDLVLLSEMTAGDTTLYKHAPQTNKEYSNILSFNKMTGDRSKHYQDMPETNLESGDIALLSEITAFDSRHYQPVLEKNLEFGNMTPSAEITSGDSIHPPMPETYLDSDNPSNNSELNKILSKTNQAKGSTDLAHSGDNSNHSDDTSETRFERRTVTPNFTQAEITHGEQKTSLLSGSPKPFYDISKEDMKYEEAMLGEFNETSGTAKSYGDTNVNSGLYTRFFDLVSTTVDAPPGGTTEQFASFSPTESTVTWDKVKAVDKEDNISASVEFRNMGTLATQNTDSFVTLDYVQTSKSGGSSVFSPGTDFAQEPSGAMLPGSPSLAEQAGQEAVDGSVEKSTGSGDSEEILSGSFDPVTSSHQSGSTYIFADGCFRNPCANGGTCVEEGPSAKCLCLPTYGGYLCQTDLAPCDAGWQKFQGFCYRHFTKQQAWEEAEQHCRTHGGHLASVWTPEEQDFIYNNYRDYQWIGLNDKTIEGDFHWSDGSPLLYENWYSGQPDSYFLSGEDCGVMVWQDGGQWSDVPCNYHLSYVCKKGTASCGEPPTLSNTRVFSKGHPHYEVNSMVRYYCINGLLPRHNPVIKCLPNGQWEEPQFMCVPANSAAGNQATESPFKHGSVVEDTTTKKVVPEFWDINWNV